MIDDTPDERTDETEDGADERPDGGPVPARMDENAGRPLPDEEVPCPYCESTETVVENARGPSACRTIYYCKTCECPFERFG